MNKKPLLIFPQPTPGDRSTGSPRLPKIHFPTKEEQVQRLENKITELERVLENQAAAIQNSVHGLIPEMILVLEIAGNLNNFYQAVRKTPGFEFLSEFHDEREIVDDFFYNIKKDGSKSEKPLTARLFLTMTNQRALQELLKYWNEYKKESESQNFEKGHNKI